MIKLNYDNGTEIVFETVSEVKEFLQVEQPKKSVILPKNFGSSQTKKEFEKIPSEGIVSFKRKTRKKSILSNQWIPEEIEYIIKNIEQLPAHIATSSFLRQRHGAGAIKWYVWRVKTNNKRYEIRQELQTLIDEYYYGLGNNKTPFSSFGFSKTNK